MVKHDTNDDAVLAPAVLSEKAPLHRQRVQRSKAAPVATKAQVQKADPKSCKVSVADRKRIFFPDPPRALPAERVIRTALRTAHIAAFGILLGGHMFDVEAERLRLWLWLTIATGAAFVALELYGSFIWVQELRGCLTLCKLLLLCLVPFFWTRRIWLLLSVLVIGSVCSHMPGRYRYYSLWRGCQVGEERRG